MRTELLEFTFRFAAGDRDFPFLDKVKTIQAHIQCLFLCFYFTFPWLNRWDTEFTNHLHLSDIKSECSCTASVSQLLVVPKRNT